MSREEALPQRRQVDGKHVADSLAGTPESVVERCAGLDVDAAHRARPHGSGAVREAAGEGDADHAGLRVVFEPSPGAARGRGRRLPAKGKSGAAGVAEAQRQIGECGRLRRREPEGRDQRDWVGDHLHAAAGFGHFDGDERARRQIAELGFVDDGDHLRDAVRDEHGVVAGHDGSHDRQPRVLSRGDAGRGVLEVGARGHRHDERSAGRRAARELAEGHVSPHGEAAARGRRGARAVQPP